MDRATTFSEPTDVETLRRGFAGRVLLPDDDAYDQARLVWNAMVDRRSAIIARCASPSDVAAAVRFGRGRGLELGVRGAPAPRCSGPTGPALCSSGIMPP